MRAKKSTQEAQLSTPANTGIQSENKRGRIQQTKISRTRQHRFEVMKLKTKNRKLTQQNKKGNTQAKSPSLMQEKMAACFSLLFSLDFKSIKPIAKQKTQKIRHIKKMQTKHEFSVSRFRFHPGKSEGRM